MFTENIIKLTEKNNDFRKVLHTGTFSQLVIMSIPVGGEIGEETHPNTDQILFFIKGVGLAILNGETRKVKEQEAVFVPAGAKHNFKNTGDEALKLITVYAPPEHPDAHEG